MCEHSLFDDGADCFMFSILLRSDLRELQTAPNTHTTHVNVSHQRTVTKWDSALLDFLPPVKHVSVFFYGETIDGSEKLLPPLT